jgi:regulatory protein
MLGDSDQKAYRKLIQLIGVRDRSCAEIRQRLQRGGFDEESVEDAINRACSCGLLDDARFARLYLAGKHSLGWGQRRIEAGLERFGVHLSDAYGPDDASFNEDDELSRATACLEKFHTSARDVRAAYYRRLLSRGFSAEIARKAISQLTILHE